MKKTFLILFSLLGITISQAQMLGDTVTDANGILYTITSLAPNEVEVADNRANTPLPTNLVIPATVTDSNGTYNVVSFVAEAFRETTDIQTVDIQAPIISFGNDKVFYGCASLTSVTLPSTLTLINGETFRNVKNIASMNFGNVVEIGGSAFRDASLPATVDFSNIEVIGSNSLSRMSSGPTEISLPKVTTIGAFTFYRNHALQKVAIGEGLTTLESGVFSELNGLKTILLPKSITTFSNDGSDTASNPAITKCSALENITVLWDTAGTITALPPNMFGGSTLANINLYVPSGSTALYMNEAIWQDMFIQEFTLSTEDFSTSSISLYPNPAKDVVNVKTVSGKATTSVYDITGKELLYTTDSQVNISNLTSGMYLFKVKSDDGEIVKRIVKQ